LIAAGWTPATPVVALSRISQSDERRVATTLAALEAGQSLPVSGPTLLIIGEVASLDLAGEVVRLEQTALNQLGEAAHA
jgi:uroporphyrin-III C-methyltransferase/precorrin-2 dehydrogenase/sirohydrochlorin ferrochelatase